MHDQQQILKKIFEAYGRINIQKREKKMKTLQEIMNKQEKKKQIMIREKKKLRVKEDHEK